MRKLLLFIFFVLVACSKENPKSEYFDFIYSEQIDHSRGILKYEINNEWVAWILNQKLDFMLLIYSLDGNCKGSMHVKKNGQIPFSISRNGLEKEIYFGEERQVVCLVETNRVARFSIYPSLPKRGFFDPEEQPPAATFELILGSNVK